eukprot:CAMPEP_0176363612 /NCGR_PEP_ID=MMETSP0126-20121128/19229_1 /TAXON_ID=141414 ORGANISM="Strombidinopsis acuminatum, Strain SPMC142" /NCGR_SAMPLE_ID=MMETSP0126 /ASSEMBLY_ACC=CAM_ASM_000229 /LENGTH=67 /DNA_ID=CAMNT_0017719957 /DNA_START=866 /DNA_END=1069 /DNA_ORIENTATION=-
MIKSQEEFNWAGYNEYPLNDIILGYFKEGDIFCIKGSASTGWMTSSFYDPVVIMDIVFKADSDMEEN